MRNHKKFYIRKYRKDSNHMQPWCNPLSVFVNNFAPNRHHIAVLFASVNAKWLSINYIDKRHDGALAVRTNQCRCAEHGVNGRIAMRELSFHHSFSQYLRFKRHGPSGKTTSPYSSDCILATKPFLPTQRACLHCCEYAACGGMKSTRSPYLNRLSGCSGL